MNSRAQASIEFSVAFVCTILFLILTCNLFVWINHNIVKRQMAYEDTREVATSKNDPGKSNFYCKDGSCYRRQPDLNVFHQGGYE
ncbi:hypothetical protein ACFL1D_00025 [Candidatus Omnitrophota bacterium]